MANGRLTDRKDGLWTRIKRIALTDVGALMRGLNADDLEKLEQVLIEADFGVAATVELTQALEDEVRKGKLKTEGDLRRALEGRLSAMLNGDHQAGTAGAESRRPHGHPDRRCQWHRQDHHGGQARQAAAAGGPPGGARRGRHLSRRGDRAAAGLGRAAGHPVRRRRGRAATRPRWPSTPWTPPCRAGSIPSSSTPPDGCTPRKD